MYLNSHYIINIEENFNTFSSYTMTFNIVIKLCSFVSYYCHLSLLVFL